MIKKIYFYYMIYCFNYENYLYFLKKNQIEIYNEIFFNLFFLVNSDDTNNMCIEFRVNQSISNTSTLRLNIAYN